MIGDCRADRYFHGCRGLGGASLGGILRAGGRRYKNDGGANEKTCRPVRTHNAPLKGVDAPRCSVACRAAMGPCARRLTQSKVAKPTVRWPRGGDNETQTRS